MKLIKVIVLLFSIIIITNSCKKDAFHSIRFKNEFIEEVNHIKVGDVPFGTVGIGETTSYSAVELGTHKISGSTPSGLILSGTISIEGDDEAPKWTVVFRINGDVEITRDS